MAVIHHTGGRSVCQDEVRVGRMFYLDLAFATLRTARAGSARVAHGDRSGSRALTGRAGESDVLVGMVEGSTRCKICASRIEAYQRSRSGHVNVGVRRAKVSTSPGACEVFARIPARVMGEDRDGQGDRLFSRRHAEFRASCSIGRSSEGRSN